jgi:hypothetical protein
VRAVQRYRAFATVLVLALTTTGLAACGGDDAEEPEGAEPGESVELEVVSGEVTVQAPDGSEPAALEEAETVPVGALVDATGGTVRLTSATADGGTQSGEFSEGAFEVAQEPGADLVTLTLAGGDPSVCDNPAARADRSTVGGPEVRRLFSNVEGEFKAQGNFSAATVRGTEFRTVDACFGTLNEVTEGEVVVSDETKGEEIVLTPGKRYWAASPRSGPIAY